MCMYDGLLGLSYYLHAGKKRGRPFGQAQKERSEVDDDSDCIVPEVKQKKSREYDYCNTSEYKTPHTPCKLEV